MIEDLNPWWYLDKWEKEDYTSFQPEKAKNQLDSKVDR